jgi:hypothetical protein
VTVQQVLGRAAELTALAAYGEGGASPPSPPNLPTDNSKKCGGRGTDGGDQGGACC